MDITLDPLDLAALLCSRVCHDVISPVGAIVNGLEVLEEEKDAEMRAVAIDLIRKSASTASAKLQFCRLAFGAAGSAGASIDTGDAESVTRGLLTDDRVKLDWRAERILMPKNHVKVMLNMALVAIATIPRGGVITVSTSPAPGVLVRVESRGTYLRVAHGVASLLSGETAASQVDAHSIQPYYAYLVARSADLDLSLDNSGDAVVIEARHRIVEAPEAEDAAVPAEDLSVSESEDALPSTHTVSP